MARPVVQWLAGVACICFVAVIWTLATVLKQVVFSDLHYDEPLVLSYVCNGCYVLQLPVVAAGQALGVIKRIPWRQQQAQDGDTYASAPGSPSTPQTAGVRQIQAATGPSVLEAARAGLLIAPVWFASQWAYSAGVAGTSVTSSTVISTTSVVWTLLASWLFLGERLSAGKLLGIAACMAGNVATLWGNDTQSGQEEHFFGDMLCLIAAVLYAAYTTMLMVLTGPETSMSVVFGILGVAIMVFGTPLVLALRREALQAMSLEIFGVLIFNGIFDNVLSQYAWAKGVQWTSPTTATVGLSLTIPLSIVADVLRRQSLTFWSFIAAALVVLGFVLVTLASAPDAEDHTTRSSTDSASALQPNAAPAARRAEEGLAAPLSPYDPHTMCDGSLKAYPTTARRSAGTADIPLSSAAPPGVPRQGL